MSLFLLTSDHNREDHGDVFVNLDKVLTVRAFLEKDTYVLSVDYTVKDAVAGWFKDKEKFAEAFKSLVTALGGNPDKVDDFMVTVQKDKKERISEMLGDLKQQIDLAQELGIKVA